MDEKDIFKDIEDDLKDEEFWPKFFEQVLCALICAVVIAFLVYITTTYFIPLSCNERAAFTLGSFLLSMGYFMLVQLRELVKEIKEREND